MSKNITDILLNIGNTVVNALNQDPAHRELPKDSWQVSYTVNKSILYFNIHLQYEILFRNLAHELADTPLWISNVGLYVGRALSKYNLARFTDVRIIFKVNGNEQQEDWVASCTPMDLVEAMTKEVTRQGKIISKEARIMSIMDLNNRN